MRFIGCEDRSVIKDGKNEIGTAATHHSLRPVKDIESNKDAYVKSDQLSIPAIINGYDKQADYLMKKVNVWKKYQTREFTGKANHGEKVTIIKKSGNGRKIRTSSGLEGWVTYWLLEEDGK